MAVDSQEKRMNAVGVGRPWMRTKLPGANDQPWRVASGNGYGGNAISSSDFTETYGIRRTGADESRVIRVVPGTSTTLRKSDEATGVIRRT